MWVLGFQEFGFRVRGLQAASPRRGLFSGFAPGFEGFRVRVELEWPCGRGLWGLGVVFVFLRAPFRLLLRKPLNR